MSVWLALRGRADSLRLTAEAQRQRSGYDGSHLREHLTGNVPGLALAIFDDRMMRYAKGFGVTSLDEGGIPVTPNTLFRIGSTTKPLTGTVVMRLVERGLLDLERPIAAYVPELLTTLPTSARITLRMLLSHSAGLAHSEELFGERGPGGFARFVREQITPARAPAGTGRGSPTPGRLRPPGARR